MEQLQPNQLMQRWFLPFIVFISCITAAVFSTGFHHYDEHYQIIEFARYFNTHEYKESLAWEYEAQIRPALQPLMAAILLKLTAAFSPWTQAMMIRLVSALFFFFAITRFLKTWRTGFFPSENTLSPWFALLFWLIPYMAARFSAEVFGLSLLLIGISFTSRKSTFLTGLFFGLAVVIRLQMVFFAFGWFLWLILIKKDHFRNIILFVIAALISTIIGIIADRIFYGEWLLTSWNYFDVNVLQNKSAEFGTHSAYYYFSIPLAKGLVSLLHAALMLASVWFFVKYHKNPLTWALIPFVVGHIMVAHKEMRFLFPAFFFAPFFLLLLLNELPGKSGIMAGLSLLLINLPVLFWKATTPAEGQAALFKVMHRYIGQNDMVYKSCGKKEYFYKNPDAYNIRFYQQDMKVIPVLNDSISDIRSGAYLLSDSAVSNDFVFIADPLPAWQRKLQKRYHIPLDNCNYILYRKR